jgi:hypothetical protein
MHRAIGLFAFGIFTPIHDFRVDVHALETYKSVRAIGNFALDTIECCRRGEIKWRKWHFQLVYHLTTRNIDTISVQNIDKCLQPTGNPCPVTPAYLKLLKETGMPPTYAWERR